MKRLKHPSLVSGATCIAALCALSSASWAQNGYQIGENPATANAGPVRLARISYLNGPVSWRPSESMGWSSASMNLPMRQGAQLWVKAGSRGELQFDDGSTMRLGGGAIATLQTMYSDDHGEFTEVKLNDGLGTFHLRNKQSEYQIDTPLSSVKANGPAEVRVGVGSTVEVACKTGSAEVAGRQGSTVLHSRDRLTVANPTTPYHVTSLPDPDQWDRFNDNRDVIYEHHNQHVPVNVDLVAGNLDSYGDWHNDPQHGYVWTPRVREAGWRPYHNGRWVWVSPWGWTWVGNEDWGYAPYHYGTWVHEGYGWAWAPGPAVQYWSPGVVAFVDDDAYVGWVPLAPAEVVYPAAIDIGFRSGNWWFNFSIGQAAAYYPSGPSYCSASPWDNRFVNREVNVYNVTNIYNNYNSGGSNSFVRGSRFVPQNATRFSGMTMASRSAFLNGGRFQAPTADPRGTAFQHGRSFASAPGKNWQVSGPPTLRPSAAAFTPNRTFARAGGPPQSMMQRSVVRANMPSAIAAHSPMTRSFAPTTRQAPVTRMPMANRPQVMSSANKGKFQMRNQPPTGANPGRLPVRTNGIARKTSPAAPGNPVSHRPAVQSTRRTPAVQPPHSIGRRNTVQPPRTTTHSSPRPIRSNPTAHSNAIRMPRQTPVRSAPTRRAPATPRWQNPERSTPRAPVQHSAPRAPAPRPQARPAQPPRKGGGTGGGGGNGKKHGG